MDLSPGLAFGGSSVNVAFRRGVGDHAAAGNDVERSVQLTVAVAVAAMPGRISR